MILKFKCTLKHFWNRRSVSIVFNLYFIIYYSILRTQSGFKLYMHIVFKGSFDNRNSWQVSQSLEINTIHQICGKGNLVISKCHFIPFLFSGGKQCNNNNTVRNIEDSITKNCTSQSKLLNMYNLYIIPQQGLIHVPQYAALERPPLLSFITMNNINPVFIPLMTSPCD